MPVSHIWYFKGIPSRMGQFLDMSVRDIERVLYYESYIVIDPGDADLEEEAALVRGEYLDLEASHGGKFVAEMGGDAVKKLLKEIDLEELSTEFRARVRVETSAQRKRETLKRLKIVEAFRLSGNRPEWMIMDVIPVIPPDLRPLVPLEGGRFATSDLNDLYRRVINRNNRLKKLMEIKAPEVILRNEKRMLQEAVDALFDNGRRSRAVRGPGNRPLKSLTDMLKGKQGRFRQNLLGKRVDYSGRSVIVVGPELKIHQCGLPKSMALELFKPFIIKKLEDRGYVQTVKSAKKLVERERPEVWDILEEIIKDHPVLLNRAPTLHRLGIQAFEPVLVEGKAITIHPLVCAAFNADFDGDQMAVHVPLSFEAQLEAKVLMLSINNILSPASGRPLASPEPGHGAGLLLSDQGAPEGRRREGKGLPDDRRRCAWHTSTRPVDLHDPIKIRADGKWIATTVGRVIFNEIVPAELGFVNAALDKKALETLVGDCHRQLGPYKTAVFLDRLKEMGFEFATIAGLTVGIDDIVVPGSEAQDPGARRQGGPADPGDLPQGRDHRRRALQPGDRHLDQRHQPDRGPDVREPLQGGRGLQPHLHDGGLGREGLQGADPAAGGYARPDGQAPEEDDRPDGRDHRDPDHLQLQGGADGARVLHLDPRRQEGPCRHRLEDRRCGVSDAATGGRGPGRDHQRGRLRNHPGSGCHRPQGGRGDNRAPGRPDPGARRRRRRLRPDHQRADSQRGQPRSARKAADAIDNAAIDKVKIRSVLTCESSRGICAKCYGRNLATGRMVNLGEAVGVIAAQSIGEPGTQLTLRTFHIGGTAGRIAEESKIAAKFDGTVKFHGIRAVDHTEDQRVVLSSKGEIHLYRGQGPEDPLHGALRRQVGCS